MRPATVVLALGLAWSLFVCLPARDGLGVLAGGVCITIAPFVALAVAARWMRRGVLVGAVLVVLAVSVANLVAVRSSSSSTSAVALLLAPIALAVVVVPLALALSLPLKRAPKS